MPMLSAIHLRWCCLLMAVILMAGGEIASAEATVQILRTPQEGLQPQVAVDGRGTVHLVFLKGEPRGCDVFYARKPAGAKTFSTPIRVNSQPHTAVAAGTIRGAQLALGRDHRVHVVWNGTNPNPGHGHGDSPLFYTRMDDNGRFEPQRNLMTWTRHLDGGGSVAADPNGNVYVVWHAAPPDNSDREAGRALYVARSSDDGKTFERETQANPRATGTCACCGLRAMADRAGNLYLLYRTATETVNRDTFLLVSKNQGAAFQDLPVQKWTLGTCPMSSYSLLETSRGILASWETNGQVYFSWVDPVIPALSKPVAPTGQGKRKHSVLALNSKGELLLAWVEGSGWQKGGKLAWQRFDSRGQPGLQHGPAETVPTWSLPAVFAEADGNFVVLY